MKKKGKNKKMKEEEERENARPAKLSHFVAPLYVAPSPTPSNATPEASMTET